MLYFDKKILIVNQPPNIMTSNIEKLATPLKKDEVQNET